MRNQIIGTLVAALILFFWQFLSWGLIGIHGNEMSYTPKQDSIIQFLSQNLEEGSYYLPTIRPGATAEEMEAAMTEAVGKPWAMVSYHDALEYNMGLNLIRGFFIDVIAAFLLIWILLKFENLTFSLAVMTSLAVGFIGYLAFPYLNSVWFASDSFPYLIDAVVQWGLVGGWLGWYLTKR
ncbi:hypothetical protein [Flavilitoribacter nigricans]|uniref:DUF1761 domain-containing protein n=1 Tax=Flavilitoribacter nigricans (strain ATCC 23147 / DSM 23189 / NBRC 102662 / NCIMB 1420 / SS-2) TaxID=1122177 RepID=A0A2D0MXL9_FLAN2|nr:hypothetical protein [Flavilitoribacter nigricans]PHN01021.1 hypothetical protein CRP01_39130 [Flavilitoribacter nigricans DSM 23189 = NBRC 102662]